MKRLKKAASVIGAFAMLMSALSSMPAVQAEDSEIYGWTRNMSNTETRYAEIVHEDDNVKPAAGERMLKIEGVTNNNIRVYIPEKLKAGKYTVSFKAYINYGKNQQWLATAKLGYHSLTGNDGQNGSIANITSNSTDKTSAMWREYSAEYEIKNDTDGIDGKIGTNNLNFGLKDIAEKDGKVVYYIDDVSVKDADGNEYVTNGGFEEDAPIVEPEPEPDAITEDIAGWTRNMSNTETRYAEIVHEDDNVKPAAGERMLKIEGVTNNNIRVYIPEKLKAGKYTVSFKAYINYGKNQQWLATAKLGYHSLTGNDGQNGSIANITSNSTDKTSAMWREYSAEYEIKNDTDGIDGKIGTNNLNFGLKDIAEKDGKVVYYIDDVSVKDESGTEYVTNGGFEQVSPMAFSDYTLTINDSDVTTVTDGDATAKVTVKNNEESAINTQIIIAGYADDGSLINVETSDVKAIEGGETKVVYTKVPLAVGTDTAKVKIFLWDSLDGMTPLKDMQEYTR